MKRMGKGGQTPLWGLTPLTHSFLFWLEAVAATATASSPTAATASGTSSGAAAAWVVGSFLSHIF